MPLSLPKPCKKPGCPNVTRGYFCGEHSTYRPPHDRDNRPNANSRGYNWQWQKARKQQLKRQPLCEHCLDLDVITPATVVDHIIPHRGDMTLFWDESNWQSLCKRHHDQKTGRGL